MLQALIKLTNPKFSPKFLLNGWKGILVLFAIMLSIGACGGTQVYTADKTVVYNGNLYNLGNVQKISSSLVGTKGNGETVNLRTLDKKGVEALLKQDSPIVVQATVLLDDEEMVYQNAPVSRYSDYSRMVNRFDDSLEDITKFMADKKKTQLKLK